MDWTAIEADGRFRTLHRKKIRFLWGLMAFSIGYYFLLPIGAAYYPALFRIQVWGKVNIGVLFALSQFLIAWGVAYLYAWRARKEFDVMAADIVCAYSDRERMTKTMGVPDKTVVPFIRPCLPSPPFQANELHKCNKDGSE